MREILNTKETRKKFFNFQNRPELFILIPSIFIMMFVLYEMKHKPKNLDPNFYVDNRVDDIRSQKTKQVDSAKEDEHDFSKEAQALFTNHNHSLYVLEDYLEAGMAVTFKVGEMNSQAQYLLDFGDKHQRQLIDEINHYTYEKPGGYLVSLSMKYKGKEYKLAAKHIEVNEKIDVADEALAIDF